MPASSDDGIPPRRNARSLDLDNSPTKAAAWVWHLHTSKPDRSTEGRFVLHNRKRSSGDHKDSRFRLEASAAAATPLKAAGKPPHESMTAASVWDCGSKLYDSFELVSFSNRLDRSLLGVPAFQAPYSHHTQSPLHQPCGVLRTLSLPRRMPLKEATTIRDDRSNDKTPPFMATNHVRRTVEKAPNYKKSFSAKWPSLAKLVKIIKKVVYVHNRMRCMECKKPVSPRLKQLGPSAAESSDQLKHFKQCLAVEGEMKHHCQHFYHYRYVHHHHHHYLHHSGPHRQSKEAGLKDFMPPIDSQGAWSPRAESARLSSETMSKICADKNWF